VSERGRAHLGWHCIRNAMRLFVALAATTFLAFLPSQHPAQPADRPSPDSGRGAQTQDKRPTSPVAPAPVESEKSAEVQPRVVEADSESEVLTRKLTEYTGELAWFTKGLFGATVLLAFIAALQVATTIYLATKQLRAYVVVESGNITNVANPPPPAAGQVVQPTAAVISNPLIGPFAVLNFKNSGTTPAYRLTHWADIVVRAFPLNAALPERPPNIRPAASVLGPGASTQKTIFIPAALTAQQITDLTNGVSAIYINGDIQYRDIFGRRHRTTFRLVHAAIVGIIGRSTILTFTDGGNDAN